MGTCGRTEVSTCVVRACVHAYVRVCIRACVPACLPACVRVYVCACVRAFVCVRAGVFLAQRALMEHSGDAVVVREIGQSSAKLARRAGLA
jgi:hypothetical protein